MFCTQCGAQNADGATFCTGCGAQLGAAQPVQQAQPVKPAPVIGPRKPMFGLKFLGEVSGNPDIAMKQMIIRLLIVCGGLFMFLGSLLPFYRLEYNNSLFDISQKTRVLLINREGCSGAFVLLCAVAIIELGLLFEGKFQKWSAGPALLAFILQLVEFIKLANYKDDYGFDGGMSAGPVFLVLGIVAVVAASVMEFVFKTDKQ